LIRILEEELREPVRVYFKDKSYSVFDEAKLFSRGIDVIAKRKNTVIAIELKVQKWRRAIQQAYMDLRVANYAFVALPEAKWERIDRRVFHEAYTSGIGLLSVNGNVSQVMPPAKSNNIQPKLRRHFLRSLPRGELE
jgi:hypothetical protein